MTVLHYLVCAAMILVCLWRYKYVSEGTWDRRVAYTVILGGCAGSLLLHWHEGELVSRVGMVWLIGAAAFRETRTEWETKPAPSPTVPVKGKAA